MKSQSSTKGRHDLLRKLSALLGFSRSYKLVLWLILGGAMMSFVLARLMYLDIDGFLCQPRRALPGECFFWQNTKRGKAGILLHLGTVLPASLLVIPQFVPMLRRRAPTFHRVNGYLVVLLSAVSMVGGLMIAGNTFGGTLEMQSLVGLATLLFVVSMCLAMYNIKRLQIEQHRAWMLRAWAVASHVITMRLLAKIMSAIASRPGANYFAVRSCAVVDDMFRHDQTVVKRLYPACESFYSGLLPNQHVLIKGDLTSGRVDHIAAGLGVSFAASAWLALAIHGIAVEVYLSLTPAEAERLRAVSYRRQLEARMLRPGSAGLTAQRLGDAPPWMPPTDKDESTVDISKSPER